jgi:hypothetical protein
MKTGTWAYVLLLLAAPCWGSPALNILTVSLNPADGALTGSPGDTVVWGVLATNSDASDYLLITSVEAPGYAGTGAIGEIPDGPNAFTDYLSVIFLNQYVIGMNQSLGPGEDIDLGYSNGTPTAGDPNTTGLGLASFAISPTADAGEVSDTIQIFYEVYDADPITNGAADDLGEGETDVSTSVTVETGASGPGGSAPEPATWLAFGACLPLLFFHKRLGLRSKQRS